VSDIDLRPFRIGRDSGGQLPELPFDTPPRDLPKPIIKH
jgi:hypothetical protein